MGQIYSSDWDNCFEFLASARLSPPAAQVVADVRIVSPENTTAHKMSIDIPQRMSSSEKSFSGSSPVAAGQLISKI